MNASECNTIRGVFYFRDILVVKNAGSDFLQIQENFPTHSF